MNGKRQELGARDFSLAEGFKSGGILYVFPTFEAARVGKKIRYPAADDLFRGSLECQRLPDQGSMVAVIVQALKTLLKTVDREKV